MAVKVKVSIGGKKEATILGLDDFEIQKRIHLLEKTFPGDKIEILGDEEISTNTFDLSTVGVLDLEQKDEKAAQAVDRTKVECLTAFKAFDFIPGLHFVYRYTINKDSQGRVIIAAKVKDIFYRDVPSKEKVEVLIGKALKDYYYNVGGVNVDYTGKMSFNSISLKTKAVTAPEDVFDLEYGLKLIESRFIEKLLRVLDRYFHNLNETCEMLKRANHNMKMKIEVMKEEINDIFYYQ